MNYRYAGVLPFQKYVPRTSFELPPNTLNVHTELPIPSVVTTKKGWFRPQISTSLQLGRGRWIEVSTLRGCVPAVPRSHQSLDLPLRRFYPSLSPRLP
jgi:hypothetical protein